MTQFLWKGSREMMQVCMYVSVSPGFPGRFACLEGKPLVTCLLICFNISEPQKSPRRLEGRRALCCLVSTWAKVKAKSWRSWYSRRRNTELATSLREAEARWKTEPSRDSPLSRYAKRAWELPSPWPYWPFWEWASQISQDESCH